MLDEANRKSSSLRELSSGHEVSYMGRKGRCSAAPGVTGALKQELGLGDKHALPVVGRGMVLQYKHRLGLMLKATRNSQTSSKGPRGY